MVEFKTFEGWHQEIWEKVRPIYEQAFSNRGGKPEKVIRYMLLKGISSLHIAYIGDRAVGMALTGCLNGGRALVIDYLAVDQDYRNQGIGRKLVAYIKRWATEKGLFDSIIIEIEADHSDENSKRRHFWEECHFTLTDYVHHYIWVPEPYQAMYLPLVPASNVPVEGKALFRYIGKFHKESFREA
ncbi:GNAT family N-acetyltransferase [Neobacillus muris]|uniref:GNAT family N-acetyltransferase n=1 Tax=Neobacillus muris TaxID=2941334 RepID=UPI00203EABCE|nr:GNAT family N-acetyltransferase [Neobacillus muris]